MQRDPHWINGRPCEPANGQWLDVFDPATGEVAAQVANGDARDVDAAVAAAQAAFPAWSSLPNSERARWLERLADAIEARLDEFAQVEASDGGKPLAWYPHLAPALEMARLLADASALRDGPPAHIELRVHGRPPQRIVGTT